MADRKEAPDFNSIRRAAFSAARGARASSVYGSEGEPRFMSNNQEEVKSFLTAAIKSEPPGSEKASFTRDAEQNVWRFG